MLSLLPASAGDSGGGGGECGGCGCEKRKEVQVGVYLGSFVVMGVQWQR